ncbi:hypothetical protein ABW21_db0206487 [Orbilia brochopaga]|nr:hypothetical protein ABW21_db0206487 [Drechslerella brochopaga]
MFWSLSLFSRTAVGEGSIEKPPVPEPIVPSRRGWENLVQVASVMREGSEWLPVSRSFILALALRGRYGRRLDLGEDFPPDYLWRHKMLSKLEPDSEDNGPWDLSEDVHVAHVRFSSSQGRAAEAPIQPMLGPADFNSKTYEFGIRESEKTRTLFGLTGVLQYRRGDGDSTFEKLHFAQHPRARETAALANDIELSKLFWLAHGYIPMRGLDFFFEVSESALLRILYSREPLERSEFWRFQKVELGNRFIIQQASELDVEIPTILRLTKVAIPYRMSRSEWTREMPSMPGHHPLILSSDLHRLAQAVLSLPAYQSSFLFPQSRFIGRLFHIESRRKVLQTLLDERTEQDDETVETASSKLHQYLKHPVRTFSRERIFLCLRLREELADERLPKPFDDVISILSVTSGNFLELLKVGLDTGNFRTWELYIRPERRAVEITPEDRKTTKLFFDFNAVLPNTNPVCEVFERKLVMNSCIHALATLLMHSSLVSSTAYRNLADRMGPIVHVSSNTILPDLVTKIRRKRPRSPLPSTSEESDDNSGPRFKDWTKWPRMVDEMNESDRSEGVEPSASSSKSSLTGSEIVFSTTTKSDEGPNSPGVHFEHPPRDSHEGAISGQDNAGNIRGRGQIPTGEASAPVGPGDTRVGMWLFPRLPARPAEGMEGVEASSGADDILIPSALVPSVEAASGTASHPQLTSHRSSLC